MTQHRFPASAGGARRRWLGAALATGAAGALTGCAAPPGPRFAGAATDPAGATPDPAGVPEWRGDRDPFALGVASGWPQADGAVLWTRLAPAPLEPAGGLRDPGPIGVRWEVREEGDPRPVASGAVAARADWAHSVRVEVSGLRPGRRYRYRFASGAATSPEGRFRTAPAAGEGTRLRLVFASCQQYEHGHYAAWRHAAADDPDLVTFLGDYVYESSWGSRRVRRHEAGMPTTLDGYRRRYGLYRGDPDLQAAHAACAWMVTWDDHEVENDYAGDLSQHGEAPQAFAARRIAAYRAWFEHMPAPWSMAPRDGAMRIHGSLDWGGLARIHLLDDRQYRTPQACSPPGHAGSRTVGPECLARLDPSRTMLGPEQEAWFERSMRTSAARWNLVAQQTLMGRCDRRAGPAEGWWTDGWDGYPLARRRLLEAVRGSGAANPLALGGDVHAFYAGELHEDFDRPAARAAMLEFVGGSISSQGPAQSVLDAQLAENPNLRWAAGGRRGYARLDVEPGRARIALRALDDVTDRASACRTLREFEVPAGAGRLET